MKTKSGKKTKPVSKFQIDSNKFSFDNIQQLYSHIASAIIPVASIVAVPSAVHTFSCNKKPKATKNGDH